MALKKCCESSSSSLSCLIRNSLNIVKWVKRAVSVAECWSPSRVREMHHVWLGYSDLLQWGKKKIRRQRRIHGFLNREGGRRRRRLLCASRVWSATGDSGPGSSRVLDALSCYLSLILKLIWSGGNTGNSQYSKNKFLKLLWNVNVW